MADPYWRYAAAARASVPPPVSSDRGSIQNPSFPGYLLPEQSTQSAYNQYNPKIDSLDFLQKDILPSRPGSFGIENISSIRSEHGAGGLTAGASIRGNPYSFDDPNFLGHSIDVASGSIPAIHNVNYERPNSVRSSDGPPVPSGQSNVLFVEGLPTDSTRREIGHLFRPFIGFRELRVVHKEPRRRGDKAMVLCFVEFTDAKCALTALEALQGYKFDDKKPDSRILKLHFAHFPFRLPSEGEERRFGGVR
ncbi:nuclear speckle RNA-binding protein A-like isoform X1 [Henckelia pumila]|uniref:nuclear speckle RNA-binding protein A-like isoform X1 n=1 Tax=Henckelia pumila TaxID=405737 RepID=UPI003C6DC901